MSITTPEQVAARVKHILEAAAFAGGGVFRNRNDAFSREEGRAIVVHLVGEQTSAHADSPATDRSALTFSVVYLTRADEWQTDAEAMRDQGHTLIQRDPVLNGLLAGLRRTRCDWDSASADIPFGYAAQQYAGNYLTPRAALSRPN